MARKRDELDLEDLEGISFELSKPLSVADMPPDSQVQADIIGVRHLNADRLDQLDVGTELLLQYKMGLSLLNSIVNDVAIPPNQKAQMFTSVNSVLGKIVADRTKSINADRIKALESCLITTLLGFPEMKDAFLERYSRAVQALEEGEQ